MFVCVQCILDSYTCVVVAKYEALLRVSIKWVVSSLGNWIYIWTRLCSHLHKLASWVEHKKLVMDEHSKSIQNKEKQSYLRRDEMKMDEGFCGVWQQLFYFILLQTFVFHHGKHRTMTLVINWEYCIIYFLSLFFILLLHKSGKTFAPKTHLNFF